MHDRYRRGERVIEKSTLINRCVIGSCQLNVLVSQMVIAVLSFSTQDKAIWFSLQGAKTFAQQGPG